MPKVPVILVGEGFWNPFDAAIKSVMDTQYHTIDPEDTKLYVITDDERQIEAIIKHAPIRNICKEMEDEEAMHERDQEAANLSH
jgi:predicted Rossmann-fold nucleotide-binding protein